MTTRSVRWFVVCVTALALAACSVSRLAYLNAPPLALWYLGGYVDMSDPQKSLVKDRLSRAIAWHRQAELPAYQHSLQQVVAKLETKVSPDDARGVYGQARDYYHRSIEHLLPDAADLLLSLDEKQLAQLRKKLADDEKKMVKESVQGTPEERREKRSKKFVEQFEDWTGKLSGAQREIIMKGTRTLSDNTEERLADRRYRWAETLELVKTKPPRAQVIAKLRTLLIDTDSWRRPEYTQKLRERDERLFDVVAELSSTLTPDQRASVQRKVRSYMKEIDSIVASR